MRTGILAAVCCGVFGQIASAQTAPAGLVERGTRVGLIEGAVIEGQRAVMLDLRMGSGATPEDFAVAVSGFELLRELAPDDAGLVRRGVQAAFSAGDTGLMESLTRELVRLDPTDTVAQLRLISLRIGQAQTVEERAALYERFLGAGGAVLDASVRSRLALDAALLQRELGNAEGFVGMLTRATELDPTNKEAASLAAQFYASRLDDPLGRLELQVNLLYADPVDPNVHAAISRELLAEGAFEEARRFFTNSAGVARLLGREDEGLLIKQLELEFLIDEPSRVVDVLQAKLADKKISAQRRIDYLIEQDLPIAGELDPEQVRLPRDQDFLRLLAADAAGRTSVRDRAMESLTLTVAAEIEELFQTARDMSGEARSARIRELVNRFVQLQVVRLLLGVQVDTVEPDMQTLEARLSGTDPVRAALEPWILLSEGSFEIALEKLGELEPTPIGKLCEGLARVGLGDSESALDRLLAASRELANPALSAWARRKAIEVGGVGAVLTEEGAAMAAFARRVPRWIDLMIAEPSSFMLMRVEPTSVWVEPGEELTLRITVENIAPIPLGFGADRTISSRLLVSPMLDRKAVAFTGRGQPEILELDRRLRLRPGERVSVEVVADPGYTGWLIGSNAHVTMRERWRVLQDFWIGPSGSIEAGPVALSSNTDSVRRRSSELTRVPVETLAMRVREGGHADLRESMVAARTVLINPAFEDARRGGVGVLVEALIERFEREETPGRVLMLSMLPSASLAGPMAAFDAAAVSGASGPVELGFAILTRVTDPGHERLAEGAGSEHGALARLARNHRARLEAGGVTLATVDDPFGALAGLTPFRYVQEAENDR